MPKRENSTPFATPAAVRFATWLTFFNTWVLFEETIVDRYGLWQYMPYYRVARLCAWDIGAMALIAFALRWSLRQRKERDESITPRSPVERAAGRFRRRVRSLT